MTALADSDSAVRDMVSAALHARGSAGASPPVREYLERHSATERERGQPQQLDVPAFPPPTIALLEALDPNYRNTLTTLNEPEVRRLLEGLQRTRNTAATPVLVWLLAHGDTRAYVGNVVYQLGQQERAMRVPLGELATMLQTAEPDRKALIAELLEKVFAYRNPPGADRDRVIAALIESIAVPHVPARSKAIAALARARAPQAIRPITQLLDGPDGDRYEMSVVRALSAIGGGEVLPTLERLARSGRSQPVRQEAVSAYISVAKPADPAATLRRLAWEQPDTALEKRVLTEGRAALPAAWQALASGSREQRRAAAALLGWFRDTRSIRPILAALDASPGALTREQLLFDLNMILLTEAPEIARTERSVLAEHHLRWLYNELANQPIDSDIRAALLAQKTFVVHPDRLPAPFSVMLPTATAVLTPSANAFLDTVRKNGAGVAFHAITAAEGVARVATTLYLPNGRIANQAWMSLYRREQDRWVPLPLPSHPVLHRFINEPSLMPTINRNYGPDHPLKILRLDLTMERVRVDLKASEHLRHENRENPAGTGDLDMSYARLLEPYKRSDSHWVKYTAELEFGRLTKRPNLDLWIAALSPQSSSPIQAMAVQVIAEHVVPRFKIEGRPLTGAEHDELVAAAIAPTSVDPRLAPSPLPKAENVKRTQRWTQFGLVDTGYGSGPRGQSGYSMLFERRGDGWVFLCVVVTWIS